MLLRNPTVLTCPKAGNQPEECEDDARASYKIVRGGWQNQKLRVSQNIVVCDGASESAFARNWARTLTHAFVNEPIRLPTVATDQNGPKARDQRITARVEERMARWLGPRQQLWHDAVPWEKLPWHGEAKTRSGALATIIGLTFQRPTTSRDEATLQWWATAIGDSCLFLIRDGRTEVAMPMTDASQFNNAPHLLCSNPDNNSDLSKKLRQARGTVAPGDIFIMATDALSAWFLEQDRQGLEPWHHLLELDQTNFEPWVQQRRGERQMSNDDTTMTIIQMEHTHESLAERIESMRTLEEFTEDQLQDAREGAEKTMAIQELEALLHRYAQDPGAGSEA